MADMDLLDVLTMFLAMDSYVELYKGGIVPLEDFAKKKPDRDILVRVIVKKRPMKNGLSQPAKQQYGFPGADLLCGTFFADGGSTGSCGSLSPKSGLVQDEQGIFKRFLQQRILKAQEQAAVFIFAQYAKERVKTGGNMRASKEYRSHLVGVLVKRALLAAGGMDNGN